jgi:hypothetical protein
VAQGSRQYQELVGNSRIVKGHRAGKKAIAGDAMRMRALDRRKKCACCDQSPAHDRPMARKQPETGD